MASLTFPFGLLGLQNIILHIGALWGKGLVFFAMSRVVVIEGAEKIIKVNLIYLLFILF